MTEETAEEKWARESAWERGCRCGLCSVLHSDNRQAELEVLVREMKAFFDVLDSKYGMYSERPTDWLKRAESLLHSTEGTK